VHVGRQGLRHLGGYAAKRSGEHVADQPAAIVLDVQRPRVVHQRDDPLHPGGDDRADLAVSGDLGGGVASSIANASLAAEQAARR
jgi:hypothetical protein